MTPLLSVEHLTGGYGRRTVVRDVSFTVERGELCALLGLNGCGKSTLLKSVCGLLPIREGRCAVDGEDCTHLHERQRALRMAYIPQRATPIAGRTVLDVVLMGFNARLHLFETPGRGRRQLAAETLGQLGLADMAELDYAELSEGQKQLVILARTLVQDAPVMLMDEPDSALDFVNRNMELERIRSILKSQNRGGLITLHDPNFALAYCDRLLLMKDGAIIGQVAPGEIAPEEIGAALSLIYGPVRVLRHPGGFVMVRAAAQER